MITYSAQSSTKNNTMSIKKQHFLLFIFRMSRKRRFIDMI